MAFDIRNGAAPMPGFLRYLGFCFFAPVMSVGPIHSYAEHHKAMEERGCRPALAMCVLRMMVGLAKFQFLAPLCDQFAFRNFILDGRFHRWWEIVLASVAYYVFLYLNFSGVCDMAIGLAGFIGIPAPENFANPFTARNIREFWNRWHITLYAFLRDIVFSPLSKGLISRWGIKRMDQALAASMLIVFLLAGLWHGNGWNFAVFGLLHGVAAVAVHYYTILLRTLLSREQFKAYQASGLIQAAAVVVTFVYVTITMLIFANSPSDLRCIFRSAR
jgi:D-alanyl-lipoteichoic acid acyltransferase DltB (MBOAT superfamily)